MVAKPVISVCVPLFNKAAAVETSLRSVLAYDRLPLEILVFDNGSSDGSSDIVARLAASDPRIRLVRLDHTVMIQESWRLALLHGRGDFLKLQSADDELDPAFLDEMIPPLQASPDLGYTLCAEGVEYRGTVSPQLPMHAFYERINNNCRLITTLEQKNERARQLLISASTENYLGNIYKVVVRKSALPLARWRLVTRAYPMPTAYPDWDFLLRLMLNHRGRFIEKPLSKYLITSASPISHLESDISLRIADEHQRLLMVLTVLADPELVELRATLTPQELQALYTTASKRMEIAINLALSMSPRVPAP